MNQKDKLIYIIIPVVLVVLFYSVYSYIEAGKYWWLVLLVIVALLSIFFASDTFVESYAPKSQLGRFLLKVVAVKKTSKLFYKKEDGKTLY